MQQLEEKNILNAMKSLDITREEAIEMLLDDLEIDRGKKLFELTAEQQKISSQARKVTVVNPNGRKMERELKIDPTREELILSIVEVLNSKGATELVRPEKSTNQIEFIYNDQKFKIVVSKVRGKHKK